jgi:hypothetical protein
MTLNPKSKEFNFFYQVPGGRWGLKHHSSQKL